MNNTVHHIAGLGDCAPSLQIWLPSGEIKDYLEWVCGFLTERSENILIPDGPGGAILILDPPDTVTSPDIVYLSVADAQKDWDAMLRRAAYDDTIFVIQANDGSGATLTRWECSPVPANTASH